MSDSVTELTGRALDLIAPRYGTSRGGLRHIGHAGSDVREFRRGGQRFVLRLSRCDADTLNMLHGEIDWISYLGARGIPAAFPVPSETGALIETAEVDGVLFVAVVSHAAGGLEHHTRRLSQFPHERRRCRKATGGRPAYL